MARSRRFIRAHRPYELCIRVREGLPFATFRLIKLLIESSLARAQRDSKVTICHMLWMGNHFHALIIPTDAQLCVNFYQELQKKITEYVKRLLGKRTMNLWEGGPTLAEVLDLDQGVGRIAYFYANPAAANLVDSIDQYPGVSSWSEFTNAKDSIHDEATTIIPWIRLPYVPKLHSLALSHAQDGGLTRKLRESAKERHPLTLKPNAWMKAFGISEPEKVRSTNNRIIESVRELEATARELRIKEQKTVIGPNRLARQPIMAPHTPPPRERRIFVLSTVAELRIAYIQAMKRFTKKCQECYRAMRDGLDSLPWPPGALRPPLRPLANSIVPIYACS